MIKSYWLRLSLFAGAGLFLALVVSFLSPKKYEAIVQILIDQKPLSPMPPMSASQETVHDLLDASRGRSITTQVEQLISYRVLQFAAEMVARDRGIQITTDSELHPTNLRNAILIAAETMSDQITLSVRMSDPELAKDVANGIYLGFRELNESNAMQLGASAVAALKNQYERIDKDLQEVDRQIQALREETNTPSVDTRISADVGNLSKLKENRDQSEIELNAARARVAALEQEVRKQEDRVYSGNTDVINPAVQRYEQEIAILKSNREALMERYLPDHERVLAVDSQIRALQDELRAASREIRNSTATQANPNLIQLKGDLSQARALYQGLSSRVASANAEVAVLESELRGLPLVQARMQELARRQLSLERNRMDVAAQLEIREAAQRGRAAPVQLVTPPTAMPEPVSPKHTINALFGLVA
ncbi:MAG TPA: hypothetical protein VM328_12710, partial [Fimbriimonadaceae bacterium]|nr:hypothetical protein [Fimbriimonadaceae bacterium]